jgi:phosphoglycolate phosphatase-like HAD superfamily hydrolase
MKLIIFDIDGTLLSVDRDVTRSVVAAVLRDVYGYDGPLPEYDFSGRTDRRILLELSELVGCDPSGRLPELEEALVSNWKRVLVAEDITIHPGVIELLERLAATDGVALGILTGNLEPAAHLKLGLAGLDRFFSFGAYGSDALDRDELPAIALDRARAVLDVDVHRDRAVIVGDSHRDIGCAKFSGIRSLAVATGTHDLDYLTSFAPDAAVASLLEADYLHSFISSRP